MGLDRLLSQTSVQKFSFNKTVRSRTQWVLEKVSWNPKPHNQEIFCFHWTRNDLYKIQRPKAIQKTWHSSLSFTLDTRVIKQLIIRAGVRPKAQPSLWDRIRFKTLNLLTNHLYRELMPRLRWAVDRHFKVTKILYNTWGQTANTEVSLKRWHRSTGGTLLSSAILWTSKYRRLLTEQLRKKNIITSLLLKYYDDQMSYHQEKALLRLKANLTQLGTKTKTFSQLKRTATV